MVARPSIPFRSANAGELSSSAAGRVDIKQYYSAGLAFKNVEPVPQGGFRQMGGSRHIGSWRKPLAAVPVSNAETSAGPHEGTATVWTGDVSGPVATVLVSGFAISAGAATFTVEAEIDGNWVAIGGPFAVDEAGAGQTRLAAFAPGGQRAATMLRIRATFAASASVTIDAVSAYQETGTALAPRFVSLQADENATYAGYVTEGVVDFYTATGHCGAAWLPQITAAMLPDLDFYAEARTIGIWHGELESLRLFLVTPGQHHDWRASVWPYAARPLVDLGGSYAKTDDQWDVFFRWETAAPFLYVAITVDGETTPAIPLTDGTDPVVASSGDARWDLFRDALAAAVNDLPSVPGGVTVSEGTAPTSGSQAVRVSFAAASSGQEYQLSAMVVNTAAASALAYHVSVGKTDFEPIWSSTRGWPGGADLYQDRMVHVRNRAMQGAIAMSQVAEYFTFNIEAQGDNAARLDRIRSRTDETVLAVKESQYLLVFSDRAAYFVPNRTIERNTPVNFVKASETGIQPNCEPFDLEGVDYYVAINPGGVSDYAAGGRQLLQIVYDDVSTRYNADPVSLLATHLVDRVIRAARQRPLTDLDAAKVWLMRSDGRLVAGQFIKSQEILGFCEWIAAAGGKVREAGMDGLNRLWLAVDRAGHRTFELYDQALFLQDVVETVPDLAGTVTGLPYEEGAELWAVADGFTLGPFICQGGSIDIGPCAGAIIGRWQAPRFESMPLVYSTSDNDVVWRPGRIHTLYLNLIDTTSLAVGANGEPPQDVVLTRIGDQADQPPPARTELVTVAGLTGSAQGTTAVITQLRPGRLRVRDFATGAKL